MAQKLVKSSEGTYQLSYRLWKYISLGLEIDIHTTKQK